MKYWLALLLFTVFASYARAAEPVAHVSAYVASDSTAPEVTASTLESAESFWPYQVELVAPFERGADRRVLSPPLRGVLIRVNGEGSARIDFGRDGIVDVPFDRTDLLRRANDVRTGAENKVAPNLAYNIGPRLLDAAPDPARPFGLRRASSYDAFLTVFANPNAAELGAIAAATRPWHDRAGVVVAYFPETELPDTEVRKRLRALDWKVAFAYGHLAESYRQSLIGPASERPVVSLQSSEGRVLFQSEWKEGTAQQLVDVLAAHEVKVAETQH